MENLYNFAGYMFLFLLACTVIVYAWAKWDTRHAENDEGWDADRNVKKSNDAGRFK